jgi:hypothetical protein
MLGDQQQRLHRGLPFGGGVFRLGQRGDVARGACGDLESARVMKEAANRGGLIRAIAGAAIS